MSTAVDTMRIFTGIMRRYSNDSTTSGIAILDNAVRAVSRFASLQDAINYFVNDTTSTATYSDVNARLKATSGIVVGPKDNFNVDTGAISGANAGGAVVKDAQTIVPETSTLDNLPMPEPNSTTTHTYTGADGQTFTFYVKWPASFTQYYNCTGSTVDTAYQYYNNDANLTEITEMYYENKTISEEQAKSGLQTIVKGLYNFWLEESFKLAYDSYGLDFNGKTITIKFAAYGGMAGIQAFTGGTDVANLPNTNHVMTLNLPMYAIIDSSDPNGNTRINGGANQVYLDRTVAHELIHAVMYGTGTLKNDTPEFFREGIADLVMGSDDYDSGVSESILTLAQSYDSLSSAMSLDSTGMANINRYISGYMFLRYLAQQSLNVNPQLGSDTESVTYSYDGGTTVISDYKADDKILYMTDVTGVNVAGDDLFLNSSSGAAIVRDARDKLINIADGNENITSYAYIASNEGNIDGSHLTGFEIAIGSDSGSNVITAGSGGSFLWGGNGNYSDVLNGGTGNDEFYYYLGNGNDIINSANANDVVNLPGISMSQILSANVSDNIATLNFSDGGSLQVYGDGQTKYEVENKFYTYNSAAGQWTTTA